MAVAHHAPPPVGALESGVRGEKPGDLGLDGLGQERARAVAQNLGQRIDKTVWLGKLENASLGHGVSLLRWRSGGVEHPHDTQPYPLMPSPTFGHSSRDKVRKYFCNSICQNQTKRTNPQ